MIKINLYGAPSSGKSTLAGQVFGELKGKRYNIAFVQEYAKELVYQGIDMRYLGEAERIIILGEQFRREKILENQVDYVVTDSPIMLTAYYHQDPKKVEDWSYAVDIAKRHTSNNELHFWLEPISSFEEEGRSHTKKESEIINNEMKDFLRKNGISFYSIDGNPTERLSTVINIIMKNKDKK